MKPNIFSIALNYYRLGNEDMVTSLWHYVLSAVPGVGQAFVDDIAKKSTLPPARFVGALDHPRGNRANRPDLLVQTDSWSVLFEHKLDSPVGPLQLDRYLELARKNKWRLAVMAKRPIDIPMSVAMADDFVAPTDLEQPRHFLWQDLQPLLRAADHPLAMEFAEFMEELGLGTFSWAGMGNPFFSPAAADMLRDLYGSVRPVFAGPGVRFMAKTTSLVYEVRKPCRWVHLINIGPLESVAERVPELRGPDMALWVWMPRGDGHSGDRVLPRRSGRIPDTEVVVWDDDATAMPGNAAVSCERSYYVPLDRILVSSPVQCHELMRGFSQRCYDHLRKDLPGS